jgi:hypothetical protein
VLQLKHVLILIIMILPMFVLAPTLVASQNETLLSPSKVDTSLPAQFVQETLRVAVYAESNTTLPSYATGGVYTSNYQYVVNLLVAAGYAVTTLTTQDILDHKLMVADYDAFVLPKQLPRENIVNLVKDYWLGGGGILSFDASIGFCFYAGFIDPSLEGDFELLPPASPGYWTLTDEVLKVIVNERYPVTKSYAIGDEFSMPSGNFTVVNGVNLPSIVGDRMHSLVAWNDSATIPLVVAFDNPSRGGKIVQVPAGDSSIPSWLNPIISDAIDWLAPRPKGRILYDLSHMPEVTPDPWDPWREAFFLTNWRNGLVNHSYIVDKLHPSHQGNLTSFNLEGYDMLVITMPYLNFTSQEVNDVGNWVANGGGLLVIGDDPTGFADRTQNLNYLLSWSDIKYNTTVSGPFDTVASILTEHPINEACSSIEVDGFSYPYVIGDAYGIWEESGVGIVVAGEDYGNGRVIACPDGNFFTDTLGILDHDNYQFHLNVANWLTAATAKVLVYVDSTGGILDPNAVPLRGPVARALNDLGLSFYMTSEIEYFNLSLFRESWDMVVFDNNNDFTDLYQHHLIDFVAGGGKVVFNTWDLDAATGDYFGVHYYNSLHDPPVVYLWEPAHPIFNLPAAYDATTLNTTLDLGFGIDAFNFTVHANATPLAGYTSAHAGAAIVIGAGGKVIVDGPLLVSYNDDTDNSTYPDNMEMWINQIGFLYYGRPTINHPADVTYMETETGNEIIWTPTAGAGAWEYVLRVNGSIETTAHWSGGSITINVDGVNASITEYQLTVYDRLGYSASDVVVLNVTEYIGPGPVGGFDPLILIAIGAGIAIVVVIVVIVMQKNKKK